MGALAWWGWLGVGLAAWLALALLVALGIGRMLAWRVDEGRDPGRSRPDLD